MVDESTEAAEVIGIATEVAGTYRAFASGNGLSAFEPHTQAYRFAPPTPVMTEPVGRRVGEMGRTAFCHRIAGI